MINPTELKKDQMLVASLVETYTEGRDPEAARDIQSEITQIAVNERWNQPCDRKRGLQNARICGRCIYIDATPPICDQLTALREQREADERAIAEEAGRFAPETTPVNTTFRDLGNITMKKESFYFVPTGQ